MPLYLRYAGNRTIVNNTCAHTAGDEFLRQLRGELQTKLCSNDAPGHVMHIKTIAEFVENNEIPQVLRTIEGGLCSRV